MTGSGAMGPDARLLQMAERVLGAAPPQAARLIARESFLDSAACIRAGWSSPQRRAVSQMLQLSENKGASGLALLWGTAAHALDFDDFEEPGSTHPSAVLVPAILAMTARRTVTLGQMESAYVAGYEVILALGLALGYGHYIAGWHATSTLAGIGAAAAVAYLLELTVDQTASALSLAMTQAAGMKAQFGTDAKALHAGLAARNAVDSACSAASGIGAALEVYEAKDGFAALYAPRNAPGWPENPPCITDYPPFRKLSPSCGYTLRAIDAALQIAEQPGFDAAKIRAVQIDIAQPYHQVARFTQPADPHEARFSVTWCVACALQDGHIDPLHFSDKGLKRSDISALEARVTAIPYPLAPGLGDVSPQAPEKVSVILMDGTRFVSECAVQRGAPGKPLSRDDLLAKLGQCGFPAPKARAFLAFPGVAHFSAAQLLPAKICGPTV